MVMQDEDTEMRLMTIVKRRNTMDGDPVKNSTAEVLVEFFGRAMDLPYRIGEHTIQILIPTDMPGDPEWMRENVLRYEDGIGATSAPEKTRKVERLIRLYAEASPGGPRMGWVVLEDLLRRMYMDFDVWVV